MKAKIENKEIVKKDSEVINEVVESQRKVESVDSNSSRENNNQGKTSLAREDTIFLLKREIEMLKAKLQQKEKVAIASSSTPIPPPPPAPPAPKISGSVPFSFLNKSSPSSKKDFSTLIATKDQDRFETDIETYVKTYLTKISSENNPALKRKIENFVTIVRKLNLDTNQTAEDKQLLALLKRMNLDGNHYQHNFSDLESDWKAIFEFKQSTNTEEKGKSREKMGDGQELVLDWWVSEAKLVRIKKKKSDAYSLNQEIITKIKQKNSNASLLEEKSIMWGLIRDAKALFASWEKTNTNHEKFVNNATNFLESFCDYQKAEKNTDKGKIYAEFKDKIKQEQIINKLEEVIEKVAKIKQERNTHRVLEQKKIFGGSIEKNLNLGNFPDKKKLKEFSNNKKIQNSEEKKQTAEVAEKATKIISSQFSESKKTAPGTKVEEKPGEKLRKLIEDNKRLKSENNFLKQRDCSKPCCLGKVKEELIKKHKPEQEATNIALIVQEKK